MNLSTIPPRFAPHFPTSPNSCPVFWKSIKDLCYWNRAECVAFHWSVVHLPETPLRVSTPSPRSYRFSITSHLSEGLHASPCLFSMGKFAQAFISLCRLSQMLWVPVCSYRCPITSGKVVIRCLWLLLSLYLFYNDPWPFRGRVMINMFHLHLNILEIFILCTLASMSLCEVHYLLQIEVSLMRVKRCVNLKL